MPPMSSTPSGSEPEPTVPSAPPFEPGVPTDQNRKIRSGSTVQICPGEKVVVNVLPRHSTEFLPPEGMDQGTADRYRAVLAELKNVCPIMDQLTERLLDGKDGLTGQGARILGANLACLEGSTKEKLQGYLLGLLKNGGVLHTTRGSNLIPPFAREQFEQAIGSLPSGVGEGFAWSEWLDHLYDAYPAAGQGFFLFESPEDQANYRELVIGSMANGEDHFAEINALFRKGWSSGDLSRDEARKLAELSQEVAEAEKKIMKPYLVGDAADMNTRVRISCDSRGSISLSSTHYVQEFGPQLAQVAAILRRAEEAAPLEAQELRAILTAQADWCTTQDRAPGVPWGESLAIWVNSHDPECVLDVNVVCEEKVSKLGRKADFHISVNQHEAPPAEIASAWAKITELTSSRGVHTVPLQTLLVGGHSSKYFTSGEKLPDLDDRPCHKSMTFLNTTLLRAQSESATYCLLMGIPESEIADYVFTGLLSVGAHETGHTLGTQVEELGESAGPLEEVNAQCSAVYLGGVLFPEADARRVALVNLLKRPVERAKIGPTEQHSISDIVHVEEHLAAGTVVFAADGKSLRLVDLAKAQQVSFETAMKARLWEKGIPRQYHADLVGSEVFRDLDAHDRIMERARRFNEAARGQFSAHWATVVAEVEAYIASPRLLEISRKLRPIIEAMPEASPLNVFPCDEGYLALVEA